MQQKIDSLELENFEMQGVYQRNQSLESINKEIRTKIEQLDNSLKESNLREKHLIEQVDQLREEIIKLRDQNKDDRIKAREDAQKLLQEERKKSREASKSLMKSGNTQVRL
jgi:DNA integrity scanning protein DisA with diadenylate cyclase activity